MPAPYRDAHDLRLDYLRVLETVWYSKTVAIDLGALFPHLDPETARAQLDAGRALAAPPAYIRGAFWRIQQTSRGLGVTAMRTAGSFIRPGALHAEFPPPGLQEVLHVDEALAHASANWGAYLIPDNFAASVRIELRLPEVKDGSSRIPAPSVYALLRESIWDILGRETNPADQATAFQAALAHPSIDGLYGQEKLGWSPERLFYCGSCGHMLRSRQSMCPGCQSLFRIDRDSDELVRAIPMPPYLVEEVYRLEHEFATNPRQWLAQPVT
jgi:hypothetical protein